MPVRSKAASSQKVFNFAFVGRTTATSRQPTFYTSPNQDQNTYQPKGNSPYSEKAAKAFKWA